MPVSALAALVNPDPFLFPPRLLAVAERLAAMFSNRAQPVPDSPDYWAEVSVRFAAAAVGCPPTIAHAALHALARAAGIVALSADAAERALGVQVRAGGKIGPTLRGTVWRLPGAFLRGVRALLDTGALPRWIPPQLARDWREVEGLDRDAATGTCACPHPAHSLDSPKPTRCAYRRHDDGSWHLTCQTCRDGEGRPLVFYARERDGRIVCCLAHRSMLAGGRGRGGEELVAAEDRPFYSPAVQLADGVLQAGGRPMTEEERVSSWRRGDRAAEVADARARAGAADDYTPFRIVFDSPPAPPSSDASADQREAKSFVPKERSTLDPGKYPVVSEDTSFVPAPSPAMPSHTPYRVVFPPDAPPPRYESPVLAAVQRAAGAVCAAIRSRVGGDPPDALPRPVGEALR